jgi:hypothetical protein
MATANPTPDEIREQNYLTYQRTYRKAHHDDLVRKARITHRNHYAENREEVIKKTHNYYAEGGKALRRSPEKRMAALIRDAKARAKRFNREMGDLRALKLTMPTACACCGAAFVFDDKHGPHSPSLDRIDNNKGYTLANVAVVCYRCNLLKRDASLQELETVVAYMRANLT